jgi:diguanylate cyclase (GGDEF)-like protein
MLAQSEVLGVFHLSGDAAPEGHILENLAVTVTEHITLSLSNIRLRETLRVQSFHDPLTGLHNRRYMNEALRREIHLAKRYSRPLSVVMLDLDHFKEFNDNFGHPAGDTMLRAVGVFLKKNLRAEDFACRYGGEEFTLILPDTPIEGGFRVAEKLWSGLRRMKVEHLGEPLGTVTVSFGVASYQGPDQTGDELLAEADKALYQAKQEGRDRISIAGFDQER